MAETISLLEFIQKLFSDGELRALFADDPDRALAANGLSDLSEADVRDALVLADDSQIADFSRDYDSHNSVDWSGADLGSHNRYEGGRDHDDDDRSDHKAAVEHLSRYITNNFIDDRDTNVDNSVNQQIDTGGGDFDQDIDIDATTASGDGAVAAGDDINGNVNTGDDNQIGDGNVRGDGNVVGDNNQAVTGDDNTTAFGGGDANNTEIGGDLRIGDGSAFATGESTAVVDNSDNSINDSGNTETDVRFEDSFNTDFDASVNDSGNVEERTSFEDSGNDNSDNSLDVDSSVRDSNNVSNDFDD